MASVHRGSIVQSDDWSWGKKMCEGKHLPYLFLHKISPENYKALLNSQSSYFATYV